MEIGTEAAQFPEKNYINGIFSLQCGQYISNTLKEENLEGLVFVQVGDGVASQKLLCTTAQDGKSSLEFTEDIREY